MTDESSSDEQPARKPRKRVYKSRARAPRGVKLPRKLTISLMEEDYQRLAMLMHITGAYSHTEAIRDSVRSTLERLVDEAKAAGVTIEWPPPKSANAAI